MVWVGQSSQLCLHGWPATALQEPCQNGEPTQSCLLAFSWGTSGSKEGAADFLQSLQ